jgi:hypothetical protein
LADGDDVAIRINDRNPELEDVQSRILFVAEVGEIVGFSVTSSPTLNVAEAGLILKFEIKTTASGSITLTSHVALLSVPGRLWWPSRR